MQQLTREQIIFIYHSGPDGVVEVIEKLQATIVDLHARLAQQAKRHTALEDQLAQDSHNSHKPPSSDHPRTPRRTKSLRSSTRKTRGGQAGHNGVTLEMIDKPDHTIVHSVDRCENCKRSLKHKEVLAYHKRQIFDIPEPKLEVTEHQAEVKACNVCGTVTRGIFPDDVCYGVQYGPRIKGLAVYLHNYQLLPYERTAELFSDVFSHAISTGSLLKFNQECHDALADYEQAVKENLLTAPAVHFDETGMKVNGQPHWLHSASTPELTFYACHPKRGQAAMDDIGILPVFRGTAVHDFWKAYLKYDCQHALCNAHHLRELTFLHEQHGQQWAKQMIDLLLEIKNKVDENKTRLNQPTLDAFKRKYRAILKKGFLENPAPETSPEPKKRGRTKKSKSRNLLERFQKFAREILAFAFDFNIAFDNNQAERDIRMMKVQQKISGTFRSREGADHFCRIRGYISTNRKKGCNVLRAIQNAFNHKAAVCLRTAR